MTDFRARSQMTPPSVNKLYKKAIFESTSSFTQNEIECRKNIILILFSSQRTLKVVELGDALSPRPERTDKIVHQLCKHFISIRSGILQWSHPSVLEFFELYHSKEDSSLGIEFSESHELLATLCLSSLTDERCSSLESIGKFLEAGQGERGPITPAEQPPERPFYNYSSRFWGFHLTRVEMPSNSLLEKVSQVYVDTDHDGLLPWLARTRLGDIYAIMGIGRHGREVLSLLGRAPEAIANLEESLVMRRASVALPHPQRWDAEFALAKAYYSSDCVQEAQGLLQEIERCISMSAHFERFCLLSHLKGLILAKTERMDEAINLLQGVLDGVEPDQNNRALLWIRLDLAELLRLRKHESDEAQANSNFDHILRDVSGDCEPGYPDEPDPPRLLALADKALQLMRDRNFSEAKKLLEKGQAEWFRPSDFWIIGNTYQDIR
ncbi:hypothetical protein ARSEF4850_004358 [Beauveria asiatica]